VRRFFELEILDRSFGLAAQAFVALLPLVIIIVSIFVTDSGDAIAESLGNRFGLDGAARAAIRVLFEHPGVAAISWLAISISLLSAFSLSRRLARAYAAIFEVTALPRKQSWRGLVWVAIQVALLVASSMLRNLRAENGAVVAAVVVVALLVVWFAADVAGLRLLVPTAAIRLVLATAADANVGRFGLATWAYLYMSKSLSAQADQYGPIGVTFALFTYLLAAVLVYLAAPLIVTTWVTWRAKAEPAELLAE
jgi:membrane protein